MFKKIILFCMVLFLTSCGGGGGDGGPQPPVSVNTPTEVESVSFSDIVVFLGEKESRALTATITPSSATDKSLTWSINDTTIATIDTNGTVTGVKEGLTKVTVKSTNGKEATIDVQVVPEGTNVTAINVDRANEFQILGTSLQLTYSILPTFYSDVVIEWSSSDESIATVSQNGLVEFKSIGDVDIHLRAPNGLTKIVSFKVVENTAPTISNVEFNITDKNVFLEFEVGDNENNVKNVYIDWGNQIIRDLGNNSFNLTNHSYTQYGNFIATIVAVDESGLETRNEVELNIENKIGLPEIGIRNKTIEKNSNGQIDVFMNGLDRIVSALEFEINYNPQYISIDDVVSSVILVGDLENKLKIVKKISAGKIKVGVAGINKVISGNIANVGLRALGNIGESNISISNVTVLDTQEDSLTNLALSSGTIIVKEGM